jgi:hypothetical protein
MRIRMFALSLLATLGLALSGLGGAVAQDASPPAGGATFPDTMGLPEIQVTLTDAGLEGVPAETEAGWHVVTFTNNVTPTGDPFEDSWAVEFVSLPPDMTVDDLTALFSSFEEPPPDETGTPMADMDMGTPAGPAEDPFAFLYQSYLAGGAGALQGQSGQAIVYLEPGDYAVAVFGLAAVAMTVTGDPIAASPPAAGIAADVTITETGTSGTFDFSAETGAFAGGPAVIEIYNDSDQPHFVFGIRSDVPLTEEEVMALLMEEEGGTPPAEMEGSPAAAPNVMPVFITGTQSTGTTQYVAADLEPGYYVLLCFVGDPNQGGLPHAFEGMIEIVPIGV